MLVSITEEVLCAIYSVTGAPTSLSVIRTGCNRVEISWTPPIHNTPPIAGYAVFYILAGSNTRQNAGSVNGSTTTFVLSSLFEQGSTYEFFVVAYSDENNTLPSARSNYVTANFSEFDLSTSS